MKSAGEPNLRRMDERLHEARRRAIPFAGSRWIAKDFDVVTADFDNEVCRAQSRDLAQHIADCHNHFLPLSNQLLFRERSEEDLDAERRLAAREIPRTARARRFPVPAVRPGPEGTP